MWGALDPTGHQRGTNMEKKRERERKKKEEKKKRGKEKVKTRGKVHEEENVDRKVIKHKTGAIQAKARALKSTF